MYRIRFYCDDDLIRTTRSLSWDQVMKRMTHPYYPNRLIALGLTHWQPVLDLRKWLEVIQ